VHICGIASRDHWVEGLLCPVCGRIGLAELSQPDGSFDIKVDSVAEGSSSLLKNPLATEEA
jgi:hypothetical protein